MDIIWHWDHQSGENDCHLTEKRFLAKPPWQTNGMGRTGRKTNHTDSTLLYSII